MNDKTTRFDKENFRKVLEKIKSCPDEWDQGDWHCGTKHCFAGWAQILSGKRANDDTVIRDARMYLKLHRIDASYLFGACRTLKDFKIFLNSNGLDTAKRDSDGFDEDGLDINFEMRKEDSALEATNE